MSTLRFSFLMLLVIPLTNYLNAEPHAVNGAWSGYQDGVIVSARKMSKKATKEFFKYDFDAHDEHAIQLSITNNSNHPIIFSNQIIIADRLLTKSNPSTFR